MTSARLLLISAAAACLAGCGTCKPAPIPPIQIKTVIEKAPVPCEPRLPAPPQYADTADALKAAGDIYDKVKLLLIGREQRQGREQVLKTALQACAAPLDRAG
jgi:hypothetical protein